MGWKVLLKAMVASWDFIAVSSFVVVIADSESWCSWFRSDMSSSLLWGGNDTGETTRTLSLVWGTIALPDRAARTERWYRELLEQHGAMTESVPLQQR